MPGTGKTQLIIKLIQYYYRKDKTILITSFTNQALTNILNRELKNEKIIPTECISR
jgi:GTPase SAR1 family protein